METLTWLLYQAAGLAPMIPLDEQLRPQWLFGKTVHEGCDRAGYYEQGDFAQDYNSPKCQVKIGCWGPVVNCNVPKRGWMAGIGGCPNVGGICIGCTMPGFPDKFMPFMDAPPAAACRRAITAPTARDPQAARDHEQTVNKEPKWRHNRAELTTGYDPRWARTEEERRWHDARGSAGSGNVVDMSWDPITRSSATSASTRRSTSSNREVVSCKSTSSIFRGYSVFMKGKDPRGRALHHEPHLRHLRRQPRRLLRATRRTWRTGQDAAARRVDREPRRGRRVHVRPHDLPGQPGLRRLLRADGRDTNPSVHGPRDKTDAPKRRRPRLQDDRRHHARLQPVHGRGSTASAPDEPDRARDDLPDGGAPRAPLDDLPGGVGTQATPQLFTTTCRDCCAAWTSSRRPCR
jgi:hypothetical protein